MSRKVLYRNNRLTVTAGVDHMLGKFIQVFDNTLIDETPEGEGLVFDWSQVLGIERNLTGIPNTNPPLDIVREYLIQDLIDNNESEEVNNINLN